MSARKARDLTAVGELLREHPDLDCAGVVLLDGLASA